MARLVREYETKLGILQAEHSRNTEVGQTNGIEVLKVGRIKQGYKGEQQHFLPVFFFKSSQSLNIELAVASERISELEVRSLLSGISSLNSYLKWLF